MRGKGLVMTGFLMAHVRFLLAKQHSRVGTPIECDFTISAVAHKGCRTGPGKGRAYTLETARGMTRGVIGMEIWKRVSSLERWLTDRYLKCKSGRARISKVALDANCAKRTPRLRTDDAFFPKHTQANVLARKKIQDRMGFLVMRMRVRKFRHPSTNDCDRNTVHVFRRCTPFAW